MKLRDVMSRRVRPVGIDDFVDDAASFMQAQSVAAAPVLDQDGHLVGIITASHLQLAWREIELHPMRACLAPIWRHQTRTVGQVMSTPAVSLTPGADLCHARQIFADRAVHSVLVVDGHAVVGIVSRDDLDE